MASLDIRRGVITSLNEGGMYSVKFERTETESDIVTHVFPYYNDATGAMAGPIPEVGDMVLCVRADNLDTWEVLGFRALPRKNVAEIGEDSDIESVSSDYEGSRPNVSPGSFIISGTKRNKVLVDRSGDVVASAGDMCSTEWLFNERRIRHYGYTVEVSGLFGTSEWFLDEGTSLGVDGDFATGYREAVSRSSGAPPVLYEYKGFVPSYKNEGVSDTIDLSTEQKSGSVCYAMKVFPELTATRLLEVGMNLSDDQASYLCKIDDMGNTLNYSAGSELKSTGQYSQIIRGGRNVYTKGDCSDFVSGKKKIRVSDSVEITAATSITLSAGSSIILDAPDVTTVNKRNRNDKTLGDCAIDAGGALLLSGESGVTIKSMRGMALSSVSDMAFASNGVIYHQAGNRNPKNLLKDTTSMRQDVFGGKHKTVVHEGSYEVVVGKEEAPIATIKIHNNMTMPTNVGKIEIRFPTSGTGLVISPDGAWELGSSAATIKGDIAGNMTLGVKSPSAVGNVITTLTHPVDLMTGAPLMGHSNVTISGGVPLPGPGIPSLGVVPPLVPDVEKPIA